MKPNKIKKYREEFDLKIVDQWRCPAGTGVPLLVMPNIPNPLHCRNPRNIMGEFSWNKLRKKCYERSHFRCEICEDNLISSRKSAHELYSYDYKRGIAIFERVVCVCEMCHDFIHSGRMITKYKNGNSRYCGSYVLEVFDKGFKLIHEYNSNHDGEILRVYASVLRCLDWSSLKMRELIKKYDIKFYIEDSRKSQRAKWGEWKLVIDGREFPSLFKTQGEWNEAMVEVNKKDHNK